MLAFTPGEPAGIGPDLTVMLAAEGKLDQMTAIANPELLLARADILGIKLQLTEFPASASDRHSLSIVPVPLPSPVVPGELNPDNAQYVLDTLDRATHGCLNEEFSGLVTGPIHKGVINQAGIPFTGHTEYLAKLCNDPRPVMMLTADTLRVALATTHLPLKDVPTAITATNLEEVITILHRDLVERFDIADPVILVCGLNPHAGEDGYLGMEEIETIIPTLQQLRQSGINLVGPLPADTLFTPHHLEQADAVLAMYHDQGLPVLKHIGFGHAINVTLGLKIIRTSVDHGTALDLAGSGNVNIGSLIAAINLARQLASADNTTNRKLHDT